MKLLAMEPDFIAERLFSNADVTLNSLLSSFAALQHPPSPNAIQHRWTRVPLEAATLSFFLQLGALPTWFQLNTKQL